MGRPSASKVLERLRAAADAERRRAAEGYYSSVMRILGVAAGPVHDLARELARDLRGADDAEVLRLVDELLNTGVHEARQIAYELLERQKAALATLRTRQVEALGRGNDNWLSVDTYATLIAGPCWREGRVTDAAVLRWTRSKDPWWRRTALVSTVALNLKARGGTGDVERTLMICEALADDQEPMVAKGLSWALRAAIEHDADRVRSFLETHDEHLPARVRREVRRKLETGRKNR